MAADTPLKRLSAIDIQSPWRGTRYPSSDSAAARAASLGLYALAGAAADETPDNFSFTDVTAVTPSTQQTSNTITVAGLGAAVSVAVSITGGTYSKNGAAYTSDPGTAENGDTFAVRHTSSGSYSTAVNTELTIGGVADTFTSTTHANQAPAFDGPSISNLTLTVNVAMNSRDYSSRFSDIESLTFTIVGTLPTGLSLSGAGVLSGTPTVLGTTTSLEVRASDGSLTQDSNSFSITVADAAVGEAGVGAVDVGDVDVGGVDVGGAGVAG
jgi:hypothetical protein